MSTEPSQAAAPTATGASVGYAHAPCRCRNCAREAKLLALAGSHLFGLAVARHIVKVPATAELPHEDLVAQIAPTIQRYLTGTHLSK